MTTFLVVVTFKHALNVQTTKRRGKNLAVDRGVPGGGPPSYSTVGTMINPALAAEEYDDDNNNNGDDDQRAVIAVDALVSLSDL